MFRELLNKESQGRVDEGGSIWKNDKYGNTKRAYGDYLYSQDREMFNLNYQEWLAEKKDEK